MSEHIIRACSRDPESGGLVLEYLTPMQDIRNNGLVVNHALLIPPEDPLLPLIEQVETTLQVVLAEALRLYADAEPLDMPDEDGEASPYDHPEER